VSVSDATKCTNDSAGVILEVDVFTNVIDQLFIKYCHASARECEMMPVRFTQFDLHRTIQNCNSFFSSPDDNPSLFLQSLASFSATIEEEKAAKRLRASADSEASRRRSIVLIRPEKCSIFAVELPPTSISGLATKEEETPPADVDAVRLCSGHIEYSHVRIMHCIGCDISYVIHLGRTLS